MPWLFIATREVKTKRCNDEKSQRYVARPLSADLRRRAPVQRDRVAPEGHPVPEKLLGAVDQLAEGEVEEGQEEEGAGQPLAQAYPHGPDFSQPKDRHLGNFSRDA